MSIKCWKSGLLGFCFVLSMVWNAAGCTEDGFTHESKTKVKVEEQKSEEKTASEPNSKFVASLPNGAMQTSDSNTPNSNEKRGNYKVDKKAILDQFLSARRKIENLSVKYELIASGNAIPSIHRKDEWAFSGEQFNKLFFKEGSPSDIDSPFKERYGISVWDGKYLKAYDSGANNGSIRDASFWDDKTVPISLYSFYSRQFGYKDVGSFAKLMEISKMEDWEFKEGEDVDELIMIYNGDGPSATRKWHFDMKKKFMTTIFEETIKKKNGQIGSVLIMETSNPKEVKPGIWLPQKIHTKVTYYKDNRIEIVNNDMVVMEIKVNEPENEELFNFQFPKGVQYYDYIIDEAVSDRGK